MSAACLEFILVSELPNLTVKNVNDLYPLKLGNFVIVQTSKCMYVSKVLDMYKKGASGCYGSINKAGKASVLQALSLCVWLPLRMVSTIYKFRPVNFMSDFKYLE